MKVDQRRNYYACGGFGHMAHHCKNRGRGRVMEGRRVEYEEEGLRATSNKLDIEKRWRT